MFAAVSRIAINPQMLHDPIPDFDGVVDALEDRSVAGFLAVTMTMMNRSPSASCVDF